MIFLLTIQTLLMQMGCFLNAFISSWMPFCTIKCLLAQVDYFLYKIYAYLCNCIQIQFMILFKKKKKNVIINVLQQSLGLQMDNL